jgi:hypothetical protein
VAQDASIPNSNDPAGLDAKPTDRLFPDMSAEQVSVAFALDGVFGDLRYPGVTAPAELREAVPVTA